MTLQKPQLQAAIWDMDGVIADTGKYHYQAWDYVFKKRGITFTEADFQHHFGQRDDTIIRTVADYDISSEEVDAIADEKETEYRKRVAGNVTALPGVKKLLANLAENGVKLAIASSAPMANINLIFKWLNLENVFDKIVFGREVSEGKPSPQIYLLAAKKLDVSPANCLVLEDALAGVDGAKQAGMKCLAVTTTHEVASLKKADLVVSSLEQVDFDKLNKLFEINKIIYR